MTWNVYVLRCSDGSFYTGIAKNVEARFRAHTLGRGGAYTRSHKPVKVVYRERKRSRGAALSRESDIKRLPRELKKKLIARGRPFQTSRH